MTDSFKALEARVRFECDQEGARRARALTDDIAKRLGFNPNSTWGTPQDLEDALKPLRLYARKRFGDVAFQQMWDKAEQAALASLKADLGS